MERIPFNREYRQFAEAAKKAGFTKEERKAAAQNEGALLKASRPETRERIGAEELISFFQVLDPERRYGFLDVKDLVEIGNVLYTFRPTERKKGSSYEIPEQEKRLIDLACHLVENAFYNGKLISLYDTHAAPLAFVVNSLAKVFDTPRYRRALNGFDSKKFEAFMGEVSRFEARTLFPHGDEKRRGKEISETGFNEIQLNIDVELERLKALEPQEPVFRYTAMAVALEEALPTLMNDPDIDPEYRVNVAATVKFFAEHSQEMRESRELRIDSLHRAAREPMTTHAVTAPLSLPHRRCTHAELALEMANARLGKRNKTKARIRALIDQGPEVKKALSRRDTIPTLQKALRGLARVFGVKEKEHVPTAEQIAARDAIRQFVSDPIGEDYATYLAAQSTLFELVQTRNKLRARDEPFRESQRTMGKVTRRANTVPYVIKTFLIAQDKIKKTHNEEQLFEDEADLKYQSVKENPKHDFLASDWKRKEYSYSLLHYDPDTMIFALWAVKYFQAKENGNT